MADWKDVAGLVAPFAPTLGKILGGFVPVPGGSVLGEWAGQKLAEQFGVPAQPEALYDAIKNNPQAPMLTAPVEGEASARWTALAAIAESEAKDRSHQADVINQTIRAEVAQGVAWYHWRHLMGYATLLWTLAVLPPFVYHMWLGNVPALTALTQALVAVLPWYGIQAALNGYVAADTNRLKEAALTGMSRENVVVASVKSLRGK